MTLWQGRGAVGRRSQDPSHLALFVLLARGNGRSPAEAILAMRILQLVLDEDSNHLGIPRQQFLHPLFEI